MQTRPSQSDEKHWVTLRELVWLLQHDMITSTTSAEEKPSHKANIAYWVAWGHPAFALTSSNSHNFAEILRPWFCYSTPVQRQPSCEHTRRDPNKNAWEEHEVSALIWKKISSSTDLPKSKWNQIWNFQAYLLVDPSKADKILISTYDLWMFPRLKSHCEWLSSNISKSWKPSETRFNLFIDAAKKRALHDCHNPAACTSTSEVWHWQGLASNFHLSCWSN